MNLANEMIATLHNKGAFGYHCWKSDNLQKKISMRPYEYLSFVIIILYKIFLFFALCDRLAFRPLVFTCEIIPTPCSIQFLEAYSPKPSFKSQQWVRCEQGFIEPWSELTQSSDFKPILVSLAVSLHSNQPLNHSTSIINQCHYPTEL